MTSQIKPSLTSAFSLNPLFKKSEDVTSEKVTAIQPHQIIYIYESVDSPKNQSSRSPVPAQLLRSIARRAIDCERELLPLSQSPKPLVAVDDEDEVPSQTLVASNNTPLQQKLFVVLHTEEPNQKIEQMPKSSLNVLERRVREDLPKGTPEEFEETLAQGRITRCIKLFEKGANQNAIKLMKTLDEASQRKLVQQLQDKEEHSVAAEVELIGIRESLSGPEAEEWAFDRCFNLFEEGKGREAMLWAGTLTDAQRLEVGKALANVKRHEFAMEMVVLLGAKSMQDSCRDLMTGGQYDLAAKMLHKFSDYSQMYLVDQCELLVKAGRGDLAIEISSLKLTEFSKFRLCDRIQGTDTASEIFKQMKDPAKQETWLLDRMENNNTRAHQESHRQHFTFESADSELKNLSRQMLQKLKL